MMAGASLWIWLLGRRVCSRTHEPSRKSQALETPHAARAPVGPRARSGGVAVVPVTHDVEEAALLSDRVLVLDNQAGSAPRELPITLPRPRERSDAALAALRHELLLALEAAHAI